MKDPFENRDAHRPQHQALPWASPLRRALGGGNSFTNNFDDNSNSCEKLEQGFTGRAAGFKGQVSPRLGCQPSVAAQTEGL